MTLPFLQISDRIEALPVVYGSGDFALEVRRRILAGKYDCIALPLPPSFQRDVEQAVDLLPAITLVLQNEPYQPADREHGGEQRPPCHQEDEDTEGVVNFVPIDPCQAVIAAIRVAMEERIPRAFIDLETEHFEPYAVAFPDPYALKKLPLEKFAAAVLPALPPLPEGQPLWRMAMMAQRLRSLEKRHKAILLVCSMLDWPWIRQAYVEKAALGAKDDEVEPTEIHQPDPKTLLFMLGELPFITAQYEHARKELEDDTNLSVDGVKDLLIHARDRYKRELKHQARPVTPQTLSLYLRYVRNLSLVERRLTPDLYSLVVAAQQFVGDNFALHVAETAREYRHDREVGLPRITLGIDRGRLADGRTVRMVNRLAGPPMTWRSCELRRRPEPKKRKLWQMRWNPFSQCSYPPEDVLIERFRSHLFDRAKAVIGLDLAKTEKFTTSFKDGIDIRETLRNWHTGGIYVKAFPPTRGGLDAVVMLFDSPADPRDYPYRMTWHSEHDEESLLAFFATDWHKNLVGPGIAQASYGGAMMIFPRLIIPDIWTDPAFDAASTMEERLLMAACAYGREKHVALMSALPPGGAWRRLAAQFGKKLVHLPLGMFSASTLAQLRIFHVLNGKQVRSYAADFIRRA